MNPNDVNQTHNDTPTQPKENQATPTSPNNTPVSNKPVGMPKLATSGNNGSRNFTDKLTLFIKSKRGILSIVGLIVIITGTYWGIGAYKTAKSEKEYEKNIAAFAADSFKATIAYGLICADLSDIWRDYIFEDEEYFNKKTGRFYKNNKYSFYNYADNPDYVHCYSVSEAVQMKIKWYEEHFPYMKEITGNYNKAKQLYKEMTPSPNKYEDIHSYAKQMFKSMERLHDLATKPTGNISTFSSNYDQAYEDYTSAASDLINESDIDFSKYKNTVKNYDILEKPYLFTIMRKILFLPTPV